MQGHDPILIPKVHIRELETALSKAGWMDLAWRLAKCRTDAATMMTLRREIETVVRAQKMARRIGRKV